MGNVSKLIIPFWPSSSSSVFYFCLLDGQIRDYYLLTELWKSLSAITDDGRAAATVAKSIQSCPTLCDPRDGSPPGSPIPGILQASTLEWVAISFSSAWKWKVKVKSLSRVRLLETPWTAAYQAPLSMGFSRQEYWSGVPLPSSDGRATIEAFCRQPLTATL